MPDEIRTRIDRAALERYCQRLPTCRTFLENFFESCGPYGLEDNHENYRADLHLYADRRHIRKNTATLLRAFGEIASPAAPGASP